MIWLGVSPVVSRLPTAVRTSGPVSWLAHKFPGLGKEFMPPLDEGSFLFMPTTMPHASIAEALDVLQKQDKAITQLPEVESAVGKIGRADTALDPAPISMVETVINYRPEFLRDEQGRIMTFRFDRPEKDLFRNPEGEPVPAPDGEPYYVRGRFERDEQGRLIPERGGRPFRLWRSALDEDLNPERGPWPGIQSPQDIWDSILDAASLPGTTSAPYLQPIAARLVMLQSGMRAPMGVKVRGPDLDTIEQTGLRIEQLLKEVPMVAAETVIADRIVGKPYLEIDYDREALARYGIHLKKAMDVIEVAIGGRPVTMTVEGRERYGVRVRYPRELRGDIESLGEVLVPAPGGAQIPLSQLAEIRYERGPQVIKSEDTFLTGYVLFDKREGVAEVDAVEQAREYLELKMASGEFTLPPGCSYAFAGTYENQVRSARKLRVVLPLALLVIFLILYLQFRSVVTSLLVFSGIAVAWAGGFLLIWLYGQGWFLDFSVFGVNLRDLFQIHPINLSVAVWVGFLALFGIATDDGVVMATYLRQSFEKRRPENRKEIRGAVVAAGTRRVRPCLMTSATTILALLPVLTSTGRGSDIMIPMAIPSFGGMLVVMISMFVVPVLYAWTNELRIKNEKL
jgi:Cu(I)/Ag(I) efflux system membrane protein CusA/SilA